MRWLAFVLLLSACSRGPSPQSQLDLQQLGDVLAHARATGCIEEQPYADSMAALGRLGVELSSKGQAEAIWAAASPVLQAALGWALDQIPVHPPP